MTDTTSNNTINTQTPAENTSREDLRLLSVSKSNNEKAYSELALLSKRKTRAILRIGNDTLNTLITNGELKIVLVNGRKKIPYVSLQEYIYSMHYENEITDEDYKFIDEEKATDIANKILEKINKGEI